MSALLVGIGVFTGMIGILADLIAVNRQLLENLLVQQSYSWRSAPNASPERRERKAPAAYDRKPVASGAMA